jgi:uncharacterized peroxidase-related enzyme
MSYIREIDPADASGVLRAAYDALERSRGKIANILKVHSLRPSALQAHLALYMDVMFASGALSRRQRELLAVVVSRENACEYCVAHHREALARYLSDTAQLDAIAQDCNYSGLDPADQALCAHAVKLTRTPSSMVEGDIESLRAAGFDDPDILLVTLIVAYFNFVNRVALGLGVAFDADEVGGYRG